MFFPTVRLFLLVVVMSCCFVSFSQQDTSSVYVKELKIIGNKSTMERIILRELPFQIGEKIPATKLKEILERAKSNLLNTLLFNFVTLEPVYFDSVNISIYITVEERWYWWPTPIFEIQETNFNTWWQTKDLERINYGLLLVKENFRGRKERLSFKFQAGYTEQASINYKIPYINKKQTHGLNMGFSYNRNHEITYATTNNVRNFYRNDNDYVREQIGVNLGYDIRPKLYNQHTIQVGYSNVNVADTIAFLNSDYLSLGVSQTQYFSAGYTVKRDKRNFKSYPTKGYYYDFNAVKNGLGILNKDLGLIYFTTQAKKYWQLADRVYLSEMVKIKYTAKEGPYYLYGGLGYGNNLVRGYEFYVINGEHYGFTKTQLRYALIDNKIFKIKPLPFEKFNKVPLSIYLGTFFDAGYVDSKVNSQNNFLTNTSLYGGGFSIDFVSYYDMVFRVEYSINKMNEKGIFIHFVAPI
jgi:outer membrane protein assembly factor BamA